MSAPPPFPRPNVSMAMPKSALLSKLEAFLPQIERENKSLAQAISAGEADKFNIEVDETDTEKPVIQMDFALGVMGDGDDDDKDSDDDDDNVSHDIQFKAQSPTNSIRLSPPTVVPARSLIQELN
ncbi:hypothetical protein H257_01087 [Aphanomyces astaci]|uniref:Uncharacterized protein n=1 Tax=Aphanomyces astaci TaxID=112090 RepID=W4H8G9_APHAT|nr:hypothetical protein H257_01087 [Aphanomyces astaci]ETV87549.1 hypothetical protein H257_01087 [Aphanomyces astaci]|eukprot:XP_009822412.1 hypothetical protein H257_01087 [Aphanomyces astaci]